jgi:hypothetical protein
MSIKRKSSPYLMIKKEMIKSKAFLKLTGTSKTVLFGFLLKRQVAKLGRKGKEKWVVTNNGEIIFPYREAEKEYGILQPSFTRALDQLLRHGFIEISHSGGAYLKDCSKYFLSEKWMEWEEGLVMASRAKDTRRGFTLKTTVKNKCATTFNNECVSGKNALPSHSIMTHKEIQVKSKYLKDLKTLSAYLENSSLHIQN